MDSGPKKTSRERETPNRKQAPAKSKTNILQVTVSTLQVTVVKVGFHFVLVLHVYLLFNQILICANDPSKECVDCTSFFVWCNTKARVRSQVQCSSLQLWKTVNSNFFRFFHPIANSFRATMFGFDSGVPHKKI